ncbi:hypothetical protein VPNG_00324 [Cytospora leucostoma]|uniref:Uncharacterized protein n=1 Tax=Cytospora leucostoma TaxID=1230097 RepID=A0A423XP80_9PEZI|nr:hypothetical protein VPNG_00324 [Cytospora leucostoma]
MDEPIGPPASGDLHGTYLERSRKELQKKVEQLKRENEKLDAISERAHGQLGSDGTIGAKKHLDAVAAAYRDVAASKPFLPFPDSVVPALVALRTTNSTITESRNFLDSQKVSFQEAQDRLEIEKSNLTDQKALTKALENRTQALRHGIESRTAMSPNQVARKRILELKRNVKETDASTANLLKALKKFIDGPLASMLAAEQSGGPVTGEMMDVDSEDLEAGFNARGKRKKPKADAASDKRQRKIDEMFGGDQDKERQDEDNSDKQATAREEMQRLTEELMNRLVDSEGSTSDAYVDVPEESAAVRFLVRSKVAEFHPRDSKRLRLVDFGREIGN